MGQTGADFGSVSTEGLIARAKRKADATKEEIAASRFMRQAAKDRSVAIIDATIEEIDAAWVRIKAGEGSEKELRATVIRILDPRMSGGRRRANFRF